MLKLYNRLSHSERSRMIDYMAKVELLREFAKKNGYVLSIDLKGI